MQDWNSETWDGSKYVNGKCIVNRPLNTEPIYLGTAQGLRDALLRDDPELEVQIRHAGDDHYWVRLPRVLSQSKMDLLRAFSRGYLAARR